MERILVFVLFSAIFMGSQAQNLVLSTEQGDLMPNEVVVLQGDPAVGQVIGQVYVTNTGEDPISVKVKKIENFMVEGAESMICWGGNCFPPDVFVSPVAETIEPGETNTTGFFGDYSTVGISGLSSVSFVFFDENNPSDSTMVVLIYDVTTTQKTLTLSDDNGDIPANGTLTVEGLPDEELIKNIFVTNTGTDTAEVLVRRINNYTVPETANQFCWGLCFPPDVNLSSLAIAIDPLATNDSDFYGEYFPYGNSGITRVTYVFFNAVDSSDYTAVHVNYDVSVTGIAEDEGYPVFLGNVYPNPADNVAHFDYEIIDPNITDRVKIEIFNLLGSKISEIALKSEAGTARLLTSDLDEGLYFYSLFINDDVVSTQKLIIRH